MLKIGKITLRDNQSWISIYNKEGKYLGTMHLLDNSYTKLIKELLEGKENGS